MEYLIAFLVGGTICAFGQVLLDYAKITPAALLVGLTVTGSVLSGLGLYAPFLEFAGAGALIPVSGFGHAITHGMLQEVRRLGWEGLFTGAFEIVGLGVTAAVVFGSLIALVARPKV